MRLRLVVKRHNLPDTPIVWPIDQGATIAQLLEQVNEVVPLESGGDWGLEDYAVELKKQNGPNFECLHFQIVGQVLQDDDEVTIRPLLTQDLKQRRASGRHQIAFDGRHLFDGYVFGRPRPRGFLERPAVDIPPRKRRRITYDEETDVSSNDERLAIEAPHGHVAEDKDGNRQLVIGADFQDVDEDDDEDFVPDGNDSEDADLTEGINDEDSFSTQNRHSEPSADLQKLCEAFPTAPHEVCKSVFRGVNDDVGRAWDVLSVGFESARSRHLVTSTVDEGNVPRRQTRSESKKRRKRNGEASEENARLLMDREEGRQVLSVAAEDSLLDFYDGHGLPAGSIGTGNALSHMADALKSTVGKESTGTRQPPVHPSRSASVNSSKSVRFAAEKKKKKKHGIDAVSPGTDDDEINDEDFAASESSDGSDDGTSDDGTATTSSSESSNSPDSGSSSNESDDSPDSTQDDASTTSSSGSDTSTSDSESESSSDSDSEPEKASSKRPVVESIVKKVTTSSQSSPDNVRKTVAPGRGKRATQARNERRRRSNALHRLKERGILPPETTLKQFVELDPDRLQNSEDARNALSEIVDEKASNFEQRRQQLLTSLSAGGVELGAGLDFKEPQSILTPEASPKPQANAGTKDSNQIPASSSHIEKDSSAGHGTTPARQETGDVLAADSITPQVDSAGPVSGPRARLNLGAGRRLLFGALGIKTPKTKKDEDKVRDELMRSVRPAQSSIKHAEATPSSQVIAEQDQVPDAWRDRITLRAVECCHEGIVLSEPPFPFVQRWDPQQQGGYSYGKRGGRGKKGQRNQSQFYDNGSQGKKRKQMHDTLASEQYYDAVDEYYDTTLEDKDLPGQRTQHVGEEQEIDEQLMRDAQGAVTATSQAEDEDDWPSLPADVSMLPGLLMKDAMTGTVLVFKQLILSEATKWQPQISDHRTAVIVKGSPDGQLELRLAKRDRVPVRKCYDEDTGERVYKFQIPFDDQDDDEIEDEGFLSLSFSELIEPKLLRATPSAMNALLTSECEKTNLSIDESTSTDQVESTGPPKETAGFSDESSNRISAEEGMEDRSVLARGEDILADENEILCDPIAEDDRHELSEFIRAAGFRSDVPSSILKAQPYLPSVPGGPGDFDRSMQDTVHTSQPDGSYSPNFRWNSSSPLMEGVVTPTRAASPEYHDNPESQSFGHNDSQSAGVSYPKLSVPPSLPSQTTDQGRQPDFPTPGDETLQRFEDLTSFHQPPGDEALTPDDESYLLCAQSEVSAKASRAEESSREASVVLISSDPNLPALDDEWISSMARTSSHLKKEHSEQPLHVLSDFDRQAAESYEAVIRKLDQELEGLSDADNTITPKPSEPSQPANYDLITGNDSAGRPRYEKSRSQTRSGQGHSQFLIPPGSQQVELLSSDAESERTTPPPPRRGISEGDDPLDLGDASYDESLGLPSEPGWVEKKRRRMTSMTTRSVSGGNDKTSSQVLDAKRPSRRSYV
ncbi:MAG: hypothetical protein M1818_006435 [Claussenomyces sp. TS43310]|nr:MAG: hypothetical protein M1818_006435 [Claussenomyces sp. TS43310]